MKFLKKLSIGAALVLGTLAAGSASAANICTGCNFIAGATGMNLGTHNPTTSDGSTFTHQFDNAFLNFDDYWVFRVNPVAGRSSLNAIFNPQVGGVTGFTSTLYHLTADPGCAANGPFASGLCSNPLALGGIVPVATTPNGFTVSHQGAVLSTGWYVYRIQGSAVADTNYSGNFSIRRVLPEPTSLALVGLALVGLGVSARRRA